MARQKRFKAPKVSTVIGQGTCLSGDLTFDGGLHLDGDIKGNLTTGKDGDTTLIVSEKGSIEGDVHVNCLILNGRIVGDVYATDRVELASEARVTGTVHYRMLEMAMGAEVNGQLVRMAEQDKPPSVTPVKISAAESASEPGPEVKTDAPQRLANT